MQKQKVNTTSKERTRPLKNPSRLPLTFTLHCLARSIKNEIQIDNLIKQQDRRSLLINLLI